MTSNDHDHWTDELPEAVWALGLPILSVQIAESARAYLSLRMLPETLRWYSLVGIAYTTPILFGMAALLAGLASFRFAAYFGLGSGLAYLLLTQLRGSYVRAGTFDEWRESSLSWCGPAILAGAIGLLSGLAIRKQWPIRIDVTKRLWVWPVAISLAAASIPLEEKLNPSGSYFAPTRHYALLLLALCLGAAGGYYAKVCSR